MSPPRSPNDRLRALLKEADWTQESLARAVNMLGAEIGCPLRYDRTAVAHWLAGTQPRHPVPQLIGEALSRRAGRSVTPQAAGFTAPEGERPTTDPVSGFAALCQVDADAGRRMPLRQRPYRVVDSVVADFPAPVLPIPPGQNCAEPAVPAVPRQRAAPPSAARPATLPAPRTEGRPATGPRSSPAPAGPSGSRPPAGLPSGDRGREPEREGPEMIVAPHLARSEDAVGALTDAAAFFAASIDTHGGRHARSALAAYLADDVAPLLTEHRPEGVRAEVMTAASRLSFLLARMYEDGHLHGMAQRYFGHAHRLASEAGDRTSWCMAVRAMSVQADRLGHLASALHLAEAAGRAVYRAPAAQQSYVRAQLAVVLARNGDRRGSLAALRAAERAAERAADRPSPFDSYPSAARHYQSSLALEALGELPAALAALRRSAGERPASDVRGWTLTQARFGQLLLRAGHVDEACAAWRSFLTSHQRLRSGEVERALREMRAALRPFRNRRDVADLLAGSAPR